MYDLKLSNQLNIHELFNRILFFFTTLHFERWGEDFDGVGNDLERGRRDFWEDAQFGAKVDEEDLKGNGDLKNG